MLKRFHTYHNNYLGVNSIQGGVCMKGSIHLRKDVADPWWYVVWYDPKTDKRARISRYMDGSRMYQTHPNTEKDFGRKQAEKLLAQMQSDVERGAFRLERYTGIQRTDVDEFYQEWMDEVIKRNLKPGTYKAYQIYLDSWIKPWFREKSIQLHEIDYHVLVKLKNHLQDSGLSPKYAWNIMNALHSMMRYAARVKGIQMPEFPEKKSYGLTKKKIQWMTKEEFWKAIGALPEVHKPIFLWLYYHFRRPGEACVLRKADYDQINRAFYIRRTLSARQIVETTKTASEHYVPCKAAFKPIADKIINENLDSPFLFVNPRAPSLKKRIWHR